MSDLRRKLANKHGIVRIIQLNSKKYRGGYKRNSNKEANTGINRALTRGNFLKCLKKQETYDIIGTIRGVIDPDSRKKKIWAHEIKNCVTVYSFSWMGGNSSFFVCFPAKIPTQKEGKEKGSGTSLNTYKPEGRTGGVREGLTKRNSFYKKGKE